MFSSLDEEREERVCPYRLMADFFHVFTFARMIMRAEHLIETSQRQCSDRTCSLEFADLGFFFRDAAGALPGHARWQMRERRSVLAFLPSGEGSNETDLVKSWLAVFGRGGTAGLNYLKARIKRVPLPLPFPSLRADITVALVARL